MPIAADVNVPELPIVLGMMGPDFVDCLSPDATPKMNVPLSATNGPNVPYWSQSCDPMPQMVYAPSTDMYGSYGGMMLVPYPGSYPCMLGQSTQHIEFPCPMDESQHQSWSRPSNRFHMPCPPETTYDIDREETTYDIHRDGPCKNHLWMAADVGFLPSAPTDKLLDFPEITDALNSDMPTPDCTTLPDDVLALGNPRQILADAGFSASVEALLKSSSEEKRAAIGTWLLPAVLQLTLSPNGTHVIQKAFEVTGGETQIKLSLCLHGRARQLLDSHHGNHVLQKMIVMMPPHAVEFIFHELSFFPGGWAGVVRHRFGCRVAERLIEYCDTALAAPIVTAVVAEIDLLSKHPFANYVVQHILEYVPAHRSRVVHALIQAGVPSLAQHKVASNVVEKAFEHGGAENQQAIAEAILSTPGAIVEMGRGRYGSFTVRRMLEALEDPWLYMALQQLSEALPSLRASKHGRQIAFRVSAGLCKSEVYQ